MGDDGGLTIDAGFSAYTSASSSNINPFVSDGTITGINNGSNTTGASKNYGMSRLIKLMMKEIPVRPMESGLTERRG